jgi:tetratricopeptide (TPR) repeat protein
MKAAFGVRVLALAMVLSPATLRAETQSLIDQYRYRANDREPALRALDSWTESQLERLRRDLADLLRGSLVPGGEPPSGRWDVVDMRAAVLMQTERALVYVYNKQSGLLPNAPSAHLDLAKRMIEWVDPRHEGWPAFRLEWWRSVVPWIYRHTDREGVRGFALEAVRLFPKDVEVRLAVGTAFELSLRSDWGATPDVPAEPDAGHQAFSKRRLDRARTEDARLALENLTAVLTLSTNHPEALLRRGRTHQLTGQDSKAVADLRAVLASEAPPHLRQLARLFLGEIHQTASPPRLNEARGEYEAALLELPGAQSARLALATVLLLLDDREGAEALAQEMLEGSAAPRADAAFFEPWSLYGLGQAPLALRTFSRMRSELGTAKP